MLNSTDTYSPIDFSDVRQQFEHHREVDERPRIISALEALDANCDRDTWVRIGQAVQNELGEDGFAIWDDWSRAGSTYSERSTRDTWRSFGQGKGITAGTLYHMSKQNGWSYAAPLREMSPEEVEARRRSREDTARKNAEEAERVQTQVKAWVEAIKAAAQPAQPDHPYLAKKGVSPAPSMLEIDAANLQAILKYQPHADGHPLTGRVLVIFLERNGEPEPCTAEMIDESGRKSALRGPGTKSGAHGRLDGFKGVPDVVLLGEGAATTLTALEALSGHNTAAFMASSNSNMSKVALAIRAQYPAASIIILADLKDTGLPDQKAVEAAQAVNGTLVKPDFGPGWTAAMGNDFNDLARVRGPAAVRECIEAGQGAGTGKPRLRALRRDDLMAAPDVDFAIKGVMPARGLGMVFGQSMVGKSFTTVDMAAALAEARDWFGCRVKQRPVVYACLEGQHGFKRRVMAWEAHHGRRYPDGVIFCPDPIDLRSEQDTAALIELVKTEAGPGAVVIVDTLNRAAPGMDENSNVDYGLILANAGRIEQAMEGFVCFVGHPGKDASRGIRGHSSMFAAMDMVLEVEEVNKAELSFAWTIRKAKDGQDGIKRHFKREVVALFEDADGDPVSSCVIVPDPEKDGELKTAKTANITRTNRERFEGFRQAAMAHGTLDDAGQFIGLDKEQWRTHFFEHSPAPNNPAKRSAHNTATKELKKIGLIYERADGLFQFDGPGAETQAEIIRAAIEERSRGKNHGQAEGRRERRDPKKSEDSSPAKGREAKRREDPALRDLRSSHESGQLPVDFEGEEKPDRRKTEPLFPGTEKFDPEEHKMWSGDVIHVPESCAGYPQLCSKCIYQLDGNCDALVAPF